MSGVILPDINFNNTISINSNSISYSTYQNIIITSDLSFHWHYADIGDSQIENSLIGCNNIVKNSCEDCLIKPYQKKLIKLIQRYNKTDIDTRIVINKEGVIRIKTNLGETRCKIPKNNNGELLFDQTKYYKFYRTIGKFHWFTFIYHDLCKFVFTEIKKDGEDIDQLMHQFRIDYCQHINQWDNQLNHPIAYLYDLIFENEK